MRALQVRHIFDINTVISSKCIPDYRQSNEHQRVKGVLLGVKLKSFKIVLKQNDLLDIAFGKNSFFQPGKKLWTTFPQTLLKTHLLNTVKTFFSSCSIKLCLSGSCQTKFNTGFRWSFIHCILPLTWANVKVVLYDKNITTYYTFFLASCLSV